jgi:hypothetical protein
LIKTGNEIGEVEGDEENEDENGNLREDTTEGMPILLVSP